MGVQVSPRAPFFIEENMSDKQLLIIGRHYRFEPSESTKTWNDLGQYWISLLKNKVLVLEKYNEPNTVTFKGISAKFKGTQGNNWDADYFILGDASDYFKEIYEEVEDTNDY